MRTFGGKRALLGTYLGLWGDLGLDLAFARALFGQLGSMTMWDKGRKKGWGGGGRRDIQRSRDIVDSPFTSSHNGPFVLFGSNHRTDTR
jgi:hypothetical protein